MQTGPWGSLNIVCPRAPMFGQHCLPMEVYRMEKCYRRNTIHISILEFYSSFSRSTNVQSQIIVIANMLVYEGIEICVINKWLFKKKTLWIVHGRKSCNSLFCISLWLLNVQSHLICINSSKITRHSIKLGNPCNVNTPECHAWILHNFSKVGVWNYFPQKNYLFVSWKSESYHGSHMFVNYNL